MTSSRLAGPAGTLAVDDGGSGGLPVILVHSAAGSSTHWARQLDHLRENRRAVALDLRGHGRSQLPGNDDYSIAGMARDIEAVVDTLGIEKFVLVGHSMGGGVALEFAGAHPNRVAGLLLLDPIADGKQLPASETKQFLEALNTDYENTIVGYWTGIAGPDSTIRERLLIDLRATPEVTVVRSLQEVMQFDPDPALARYRGPKLSIVTASNNEAFSLHRLGKGFPYRVVTGTGHWIQLDKPAEFNRLMDDFLENNVSGK
jgi:pimeloyl-ACP methyl ester carboxylesterase